MATTGDKHPAAANFESMRVVERERERARRATKDPSPPPRFGVALSGGGIRSAAFCLGALQALEERDLYSKIDYLSTVSGGGYVGLGLIAAQLRSWQNRGGADPSAPVSFPFSVKEDPPPAAAASAPSDVTPSSAQPPAPNGPAVVQASLAAGASAPVGPEETGPTASSLSPPPPQGTGQHDPVRAASSGAGDGRPPVVGVTPLDIADSDLVRAFRDRSRYMMPDGPWDLVVSAAIVMRGIAVNMLLFAPVLFLIAAATLLLNPTVKDLHENAVTGSNIPFQGTLFGILAFLGAAMLWGLAVAIWPALSRRNSARGSIWENRTLLPRLAAAGLVAVLLAAAWGIHILFVTLFTAMGTGTGDDPLLTIPGLLTALGAGTGLLGLVWKRLQAIIERASIDSSWGSLIRAASARLTGLLLALALPAFLYIILLLMIDAGMIRTSADCLDLVSTPIWCYPEAPEWFARFIPVARAQSVPVLAAVALAVAALLILNVASLVVRFLAKVKSLLQPNKRLIAGQLVLLIALLITAILAVYGLPISNPVAGIYAAIALICMALAYPLTENATSLHRLYRDRLEEAFGLGKQSPGIAGADVPLPLADLRAFYDAGQRPYLIANMTINLSGSRRKNRRGRNGDFFTATADYVGSDATGYVRSDLYRPDPERDVQLDLGSIAAISGAAASSRSGRVGSALLAPTLALLNIRLGVWLCNPRQCGTTADTLRSRSLAPRLYLLDEILGLLDEERPMVYVTDGGHIDNLGLYQLLKRRCPLIIVIDAEQDPAFTCSELADVERFARIDLGVRLEIDLDPLRTAALERRAALAASKPGSRAPVVDPRSHAAIGRILYPPVMVPADADSGLTAPEAQDHVRIEQKAGTLIYIKALATGDEASYVLDYERRFPDFPHETTGDQFFSEEQFEAYRALGFHATRDAVRKTGNDPDRDAILADLFRQLGVPRKP